MSQNPKIIAQSAPTINTLTTIYTVPTSTSAVISTIVVCNTSPDMCRFNVSVAIGGAADTPAQYILYQIFMPAGTSYIGTIGITMAATDELRCQTDTAGIVFNVFGVENT